jgi:hypothetical protein
MRKILLSTAAFGMLAASGASAQVLATIDDLVGTVTGATPNTAVFSGIAENSGFIDGSVNIDGAGMVESSNLSDSTSDFSTSLDSVLFTNNAQGSTLVGGSTVSILSNVAGLVNCDAQSAADGAEVGCDFGAEGVNFNDLVTTVSTVANASTQMNFGDVSSLAVGAVNQIDMDVTMSGASSITDLAANTTDTASTAVLNALEAASVVGTTIAWNNADIDGSANIDLGMTSASFSSIGTTAAGAINTGTITSMINGE